MCRLRLLTTSWLGLAVVLVASAQSPATVSSAVPGSVNYIEGQASIGMYPIAPDQMGAVRVDMGQVLSTGEGKAEMLLTPGVFLRIGGHSAVSMISNGILDTEVRMEQGRGLLEVAQIYSQDHLLVDMSPVLVRVLQRGLYDFDADAGVIRVFEGKVEVNEAGRTIDVKAGHALFLDGSKKSVSFDRAAFQDDLYQWSSLRAAYLAEASVGAAQDYVPDNGVTSAPWYGSGWYWDTDYNTYTYLPGSGICTSLFGWGFYSPIMVYSAPFHPYAGYPRHFDRGFQYGVLPRNPGVGFQATIGGAAPPTRASVPPNARPQPAPRLPPYNPQPSGSQVTVSQPVTPPDIARHTGPVQRTERPAPVVTTTAAPPPVVTAPPAPRSIAAPRQEAPVNSFRSSVAAPAPVVISRPAPAPAPVYHASPPPAPVVHVSPPAPSPSPAPHSTPSAPSSSGRKN